MTPSQIAELESTGTVAVRDDAPITDLALMLALSRLQRSAARHNPPRCPDCGEDINDGPCVACQSRITELAA